MKHAPGPWISELDTSGPNHITNIRTTKENGFMQICEVNRYVDCKLDGANTALISAAPEMLNALVLAHETLLIRGALQTAFEVKKVIKKATGENENLEK